MGGLASKLVYCRGLRVVDSFLVYCLCLSITSSVDCQLNLSVFAEEAYCS